MSYNIVLAAILVMFSLCFIVLLNFSWQNKETPISRTYGLGVLAAFFYTFGYAFQLVSTTADEMLFWIRVQYLGIPFGALLYLIMILQYTGKDRYVTKRNVALLTIPPIFVLLANYTNELHFLFYKTINVDQSLGFPVIDLDRGPLFYSHISLTYAYYLVGFCFLLPMVFSKNLEKRKQALLMLIGSFLVFLFPLIHALGLMPIPIDISPFGLIFSAMFYLWGIHQFNMLKLSPLAMKKVFESIHDIVIIFDLDNALKSYNKSAHRFFEQLELTKCKGCLASEVLAPFPEIVNMFSYKAETNRVYTQSLQLGNKYYHVQFTFIDGNNNTPIGKMILLHDITDSILYKNKLIQQAKKYEYLAHHDALTGIYNRMFFEKEVKIRLLNSKHHSGALLMCDLNFFKEINDQLGHLTGDNVLIFTAQNLQTALPKPNLLARLGGDEFIVYFDEIDSKEQFMLQIDNVRNSFKKNLFRTEKFEIEISPSLGIAFVEETGKDYEKLYHMCDERMYEDKKKIKKELVKKEVSISENRND